MKNTQLAEALAARGDRFSQLMSKLVRDEYVGDQLLSRSGLSDEEHAELEVAERTAHTPLSVKRWSRRPRGSVRCFRKETPYTLSIIQASNMVTGWGTYYEPTHPALRAR